MSSAAAASAGRARHLLVTLALALAAAPAAAQLGPPDRELWPRWTAHAAASTLAVDDRPYAAFLARYLVVGRDGVNRLRYGRVSAADKALLRRYIASLEATDVDRLTRPRQMAFWINLYNATTVDLVLEAYPVGSIRSVRSLLTLGPWRDKVLTVKGEALSLDDIEHRILRPIWKDTRIHYAVNCASYGCPNLAATPYRAETLGAMLDDAARAYINHPRGFRVEDGALQASSIFKWYQGDWGSEAEVLRQARRHATPATLKLLAGRTTIDGYDYDWTLNDAK